MSKRKLAILGYILFGIGVILIIMGIFTGSSHVALFLIFPVIYGKGLLSFLGCLLIFFGIFLILLSLHFGDKESEEYYPPPNEEYYPPPNYEEFSQNEIFPQKEVRKEKRYGGVILIGPIPIVIGSDKNMVIIALTISLIILSLFIIYLLHG